MAREYRIVLFEKLWAWTALTRADWLQQAHAQNESLFTFTHYRGVSSTNTIFENKKIFSSLGVMYILI